MSAQCPQPPKKTPGYLRPGRTREAQQAKRFHRDLIAHLGGNPSITQLALVDQAMQLKRRLLNMDRRFTESGAFTGTAKEYLAWSNSLSRLLRSLGLHGAKPATPDLRSYLAAKAAGTPVSGTTRRAGAT